MKHNEGFLKLVEEARKQVKEIRWPDLEALRKKYPGILVVDVREDNEAKAGMVPDAIHLGKGVIERDIEKQIPNRDTPIALYCGGGFRSALAAVNIQQMGYKNVWSIDGGFRDWTTQGGSVVKKTSLTVLALLIMSSFSFSGCTTTFYGASRVKNGPQGCMEKCSAWNLNFDGMVAMGEYSDACICGVKPGATTKAAAAAIAAEAQSKETEENIQ